MYYFFFILSVFYWISYDYFLKYGILMCMMIFFLVFCVLEMVSVSPLFEYYLLQEFSGFFFLFNISVELQFLCLLLKGGFSPFFYTSFFISNFLGPYSFIFFMTFYKFYIFLFSLEIMSADFFIFFLFSLLLVYLSMWGVSDLRCLSILSGGEVYSWFFIYAFNHFEFWSIFMLFFYFCFIYFFLLYNMKVFSLDLSFFLMSSPLSLIFMLKYLGYVSALMFSPFWIFFLFFLFFLSISGSLFFLFFYIYKLESFSSSTELFFIGWSFFFVFF